MPSILVILQKKRLLMRNLRLPLCSSNPSSPHFKLSPAPSLPCPPSPPVASAHISPSLRVFANPTSTAASAHSPTRVGALHLQYHAPSPVSPLPPAAPAAPTDPRAFTSTALTRAHNALIAPPPGFTSLGCVGAAIRSRAGWMDMRF